MSHIERSETQGVVRDQHLYGRFNYVVPCRVAEIHRLGIIHLESSAESMCFEEGINRENIGFSRGRRESHCSNR